VVDIVGVEQQWLQFRHHVAEHHAVSEVLPHGKAVRGAVGHHLDPLHRLALQDFVILELIKVLIILELQVPFVPRRFHHTVFVGFHRSRVVWVEPKCIIIRIRVLQRWRQCRPVVRSFGLC
jgi:hypothetical protein